MGMTAPNLPRRRDGSNPMVSIDPTCLICLPPSYNRISMERWNMTMDELELLLDYDGEDLLLAEQKQLLIEMKEKGYKPNERIITYPLRSNSKVQITKPKIPITK